MRNKFFSYCIWAFALAIISGCSSSYHARSGRQALKIGEYYAAISKLQKAQRKEKEAKVRLSYDSYIADAYWRIGDYKKAGLRYRNLVSRKYPDSLALFRLAESLRFEEKYDEALPYYQQHLDSFPDNQRTLNAIEAIKLTKQWMEKPSRFEVSQEKQLNSRYAEYSPAFVAGMDNSLIFTSTREGSKGKRKSEITGQRNGDLFKASFNLQRQRWNKPEPLDNEGLINTLDDEGAVSMIPDGSQLYFTRCKFDKRKALGAQVFISANSRETWSEANLVNLAPDSLVSAHPSISADGQTLYFVSDMEGGYGGMDIWKVEKTSGDWGAPENLGGDVNTPGNEVFPYIRDNGELYFSSDYHPGMGGLDIFKAVFIEGVDAQNPGKWLVENMQSPLNSTGDDFAPTFLPRRDQGMFSSNRKGAMGDDLFSFNLPPLIYRVEGQIVNSQTDLRENNAFVRVIGTDGTNLKIKSNDGKFQFRLQPNTEYILAAFKEGFLNSKKNLSTINLTDSKSFEVVLPITPTDAPINVENIQYEFGRHDLLPGSIQALDSLVAVLNLNPTIVIELMSHTDHVGSLEYNSALSQRRAQSVVDYLISKGINSGRLVAKGYGETWPKKVTEAIALKYDFLKKGDELTEIYINRLSSEDQKEIAKSLNRRTEFRVLRSDFRD